MCAEAEIGRVVRKWLQSSGKSYTSPRPSGSCRHTAKQAVFEDRGGLGVGVQRKDESGMTPQENQEGWNAINWHGGDCVEAAGEQRRMSVAESECEVLIRHPIEGLKWKLNIQVWSLGEAS